MAESKNKGDYIDAYAVANVMYNRITSHKWVDWINHVKGNGDNLYTQATHYNQFVVYQNGLNKPYLGKLDNESYQAAIDMFYSGERIHYYLQFRSSNTKVSNFTQFSENGNKFFDQMLEEDIIFTDENTLTL